MKRRLATAVTAGTLGTASVLGIGLVAPAARAADQDSASVSQEGDEAWAIGQDRGAVATPTSVPAAGILGPGGTNLETAADVLGMEVSALREELDSGATLGDLARAHGIEQVALVRALAQEQETRLEQWFRPA